MLKEQTTVLGRLTELHGRLYEVATRLQNDVQILTDLQREISVIVGKLWTLQEETVALPVTIQLQLRDPDYYVRTVSASLIPEGTPSATIPLR